MTVRPPWVANRIADLALEAARDRARLQAVRAFAERAREAGLLLDPAEVEAVLDGANDHGTGAERGTLEGLTNERAPAGNRGPDRHDLRES